MGGFDALTHLEEAKDKHNAAEIHPAKKPAAPVIPIAKEKSTRLLANQQTSKEANQQTTKPVNQQNTELVNQQTSKLALSTKEKRKYGTYLRPDSILKIQIQAAQEQKKDHELLQEIVDWYYSTHEK